MGPLSGYRIIEMKGIGPGPYAGMILADLGAEVIVVERSKTPGAMAPPSAMDVTARGKMSVILDLKTQEGLDTLLGLVDSADGLFEGFRPGVAERLGFGPEICLKRNPSLVYGRMTGWGQTGPLSHSAGHDLNYISLTGAAAAIGSSEKPIPPLNLVGDFAGGSLFLVIGMLSALLEASKSGLGQVVDAAITDGAAHLMSVFYTLDQLGVWSPERASNILDGASPYYRAYETADGKFVSVAAIETHFFAELVKLADLPETFIQDQNNKMKWPDMSRKMEATFKTRTRDEWVEVFEGTDACVAGILTYTEAHKHPHNQARETFFRMDESYQPSPAPRFSRTACGKPSNPPCEGQDTDRIVSELYRSSESISS